MKIKEAAVEAEQLRLFDFGGIDLGKLREIGHTLRSNVGARLTVRGYAADMRGFESWCREFGRKSAPASAETVTLYVTWCLHMGKRVGTVNRHLAAIVDAHRRAELTPPPLTVARQTISAMRRERGEQPKGKAALTADSLFRAARWSDVATNAGARDRALLVLGFAAALRRSELVALQLSDITFHDEGICVTLRRSKTDQEGQGRQIPVWPGKRSSTDPVRALSTWIAKRGRWPGPLFCRIQTGDVIVKAGITGDAVNDLVKRCVASVGLDADLYGAHSLRIGAVSASAKLGRSDQELMALSGHTTATMVKKYVRSERLFSGRNPLAGVL